MGANFTLSHITFYLKHDKAESIQKNQQQTTRFRGKGRSKMSNGYEVGKK
jgi:hypothetical protein